MATDNNIFDILRQRLKMPDRDGQTSNPVHDTISEMNTLLRGPFGHLAHMSHAPTAIGYLVLAIVLLMYRDLSGPTRQYLVPSLVVYVLFVGLVSGVNIICWKRQLTKATVNNEVFTGVSNWFLGCVILAQLFAIDLLVWYLHYREVL